MALPGPAYAGEWHYRGPVMPGSDATGARLCRGVTLPGPGCAGEWHYRNLVMPGTNTTDAQA
eukprot:10581224-Alexandrium_andersonii.AAC.1